MMSLFAELNSLMVKYRFRPRKSNSQHFVLDERLIQRMVDSAGLKKQDTVLEIGAGCGFLTRELLKHCSVVAVESDPALAELLRSELPQEKLTVVEGNFLDAKLPEFNKVVSLPPYAVSTDITYRLLELGFESAVLVFQREFAEKLVAEPGFSEYCALSVMVNYFSEPELLIGNISPKSFFPAPQTFSSLVRMYSKKRFGTAADEHAFREFVQSIFRFRNKNTSNALVTAAPFLGKHIKIPLAELKGFLVYRGFDDTKVSQAPVDFLVGVFNHIWEQSHGRPNQ